MSDWTEERQRAWLEALAVGARVGHSDPRASGLLGTVVDLYDPDMHDIRVQWDKALPWLSGDHAANGWHSAGFLRPVPEGTPELPAYERARLQLVAAERLLDEKKRWCQGALAYTDDGEPTTPFSYAACQWCLMGALGLVTHTVDIKEDVGVLGVTGMTLDTEAYDCLRRAAADRVIEHGPASLKGGMLTLGVFNDHHGTTHGAICSVLHAAVGIAETERDFDASS